MTSDCVHSPNLSLARSLAFVCLLFVAVLAPVHVLRAQGHEAATPAEAGATTEAPHEQSLLQTVARLANFAILAGALVYFLKGPIGVHLASRASHIRQDLVDAAQIRETATARLAEIERKLRTLPAELEALKAQGAQDLLAEQARIAETGRVERERLLQQTRREIDTRLRVARRDLTVYAAELAVGIAEARIKASMTPDDQLRLVDRYTTQIGDAR
jgi:F-type H+-transporting ATPase subunit b